jgi:hypothetical protein
MHTSKYLQHTAVTMKVLCTLLVLIVLTGFVQLIAVGIYGEVFRDPNADKPVAEATDLEKKQIEINNSEKAFTLDGTLYLVNYNVTDPGIHSEGNTVVKDSSGNLLFTGKEQDNPYSFIQWHPKAKPNYSNQSISRRTLRNLNMMDGEFTSTYAIPIVNLENKRTGHWFWDAKKGYFQYYSTSGRPGGYIGANGYAEDGLRVEPFDECVLIDHWLKPNSLEPMLLFRADSAVYQIDFQNKQVETLVKTPNDLIRSMEINNWKEIDSSNYRPTLSVITKSHKLFLLLKNPEQIIETQLSSDFYYFNTPRFAAFGDKIWATSTETLGMPKTDDRQIYISWYMDNRDKPWEHKIRLFELDKNGSFFEKNSFIWTRPKHPPRSADYIRAEAFVRFINSFSSPLLQWINKQIENQIDYNHEVAMYVGAIWDFNYKLSKINRFTNFGLMTLFAAVTLLHGRPRRTSVIKLVFWAGFVFIFNLAGFLTYLALNHTPVVKCASCGKRRGLEKDACCHCGAVLPSPKSKETDLITTLSA